MCVKTLTVLPINHLSKRNHQEPPKRVLQASKKEHQMLLELLKTVYRHVIQPYQHLQLEIPQKLTKASVLATKTKKV